MLRRVLCAAMLLVPFSHASAIELSPAAAQNAPLPRDPGQIVYLGDSRLAAQFEDPGQRVATARFFGNVATQILDRRLRTAANLATSGFRSDQYLTDEVVTRAIATRAAWVAVFGVVNDLSQRGPQNFFDGYPGGLPGGIRTQVDKLLAAGMRPILILEPGSASLAQHQPSQASIAAYNDAIRNYAAAHPEVVVFDMPAVVADPGRPGAFRAGFLNDGTHLDTLGGYAVGEAFARLMNPLLLGVAPPAALTTAPTGLAANGRFEQATGGLAAAGTTGAVPASYVAHCTDGLQAVLSTVPDPAGGNRLTMQVAASTPGSCDVGFDIAGEEVGKAYEEFVRASVAEGAVGLSGPYLQLQINRNGQSVDAFDNYWSVTGPGPFSPRTLELRTPPLTIPAGRRGWFTSRLGVHFSQPGSAVVSFADHKIVEAVGP